MDKLKFIHAISRLRVLETRLLDKSKLDRMIDSPNAEAALKILADNNYGEQGSSPKRPEDYEIVLRAELKKLYQLLYEMTPEKSLVDIMSLRYDYHNLKVLLKAEALKKDLDYLLAGVSSVPVSTLKNSLANNKFEELSPLMKEAILAAKAAYEKTQDPQEIDLILDRYQYLEMMAVAKGLGDPWVIDYLKMSVDFINIKTFIRIKKQKKDHHFLLQALVPGGDLEISQFEGLLNEAIESFVNVLKSSPYIKMIKNGLEDFEATSQIHSLEKEMENALMAYIKEGKYVTFGVEPLIAFILAKETEIKNARIIMVGKINNVTPSAIRERMRDIYV